MTDMGNNLWWCDQPYCRSKFTLTEHQQKIRDNWTNPMGANLAMMCPVHDAVGAIQFDVAEELVKREKLKIDGKLVDKKKYPCLYLIHARAEKGDELCIRLWQEIKKESLRRAKIRVKANA